MKVLMIGNHENVHGGITSVIKQILNFSWEKDNIKMKFIATYNNGNFVYKACYFIRALIKIFFELLNRKIDCVHIHMSHTGSFFRANIIKKICDKFKVPVLVHLHGSEFEKFYYKSSNTTRKKIEKFLNEIFGIIVLGKKWENFIKKIVPSANICVLNNSVKIPEKIVIQEKKIINFLFMGVLIDRKGVKDLLKAIKLIDDDMFKNYEIKFNIAGNGIEYENLLKFSVDNNLKDKVNLLGWVSDTEKDEVIKNNHVMILPSYNEGLPIAILEAISYGLPIIATDVGSVKEAVIELENGYLINPGDVEELKNKINKMIMDFDTRKRMGLNSRKIAKQFFDEEVYYNKLLDIYMNINRGE